MPFVITEACIDVKDRTCLEQCPVDCIYEGDRKLYIQPIECIDCGACEPTCPVDAIYQDHQVPRDSAMFVEDNARFFAEPLPGRVEPLGEPGGSMHVPPIGTDTPLVRGWDATAR